MDCADGTSATAWTAQTALVHPRLLSPRASPSPELVIIDRPASCATAWTAQTALTHDAGACTGTQCRARSASRSTELRSSTGRGPHHQDVLEVLAEEQAAAAVGGRRWAHRQPHRRTRASPGHAS